MTTGRMPTNRWFTAVLTFRRRGLFVVEALSCRRLDLIHRCCGALLHVGRLLTRSLCRADNVDGFIQCQLSAELQKLATHFVVRNTENDLSQQTCVLAGSTAILLELALASNISKVAEPIFD